MGKHALLEKINALSEDERHIIRNHLDSNDEITSMNMLRLYVPGATYSDLASLHDIYVRHVA